MPIHGKIHAGGGLGTHDSWCGVPAWVSEVVPVPENDNPLFHITCMSCKRIAGRRVAQGRVTLDEVVPVKLNYVPGHWMSDSDQDYDY